MKIISAFLATGLLAVPAFAQQNGTSLPVIRSGETILWPEQGYKAIPAPLYKATNAPETAASPQDGTSLDTLSQYLDRATQLAVYGYNDGTNNWPLTGTNTIYSFLGTQYRTTAPISVKGILIAYAAKQINSEPDSLIATLFSVNPQNGLPSQQLGGVIFTSDDIDTSSTAQTLTYIEFPSNISVTSDFIAFVQTVGASRTAPPDLTDFTVIFSNRQGDGRGENNGIFLAPDENLELVAVRLSELTQLQIEGSAPNFDPIIMPVIEVATTGVGEDAVMNGLALKGAYPSPAADKSAIRFALDKPSFVEISLLDMTGKTVLSVRRDNMAAGEQAVDLDVSSLNAGSYLYTVRTASSALAGKMTVVK